MLLNGGGWAGWGGWNASTKFITFFKLIKIMRFINRFTAKGSSSISLGSEIIGNSYFLIIPILFVNHQAQYTMSGQSRCCGKKQRHKQQKGGDLEGAQHPKMKRTVPHNREFLGPKMSIVLRLRNPN